MRAIFSAYRVSARTKTPSVPQCIKKLFHSVEEFTVIPIAEKVWCVCVCGPMQSDDWIRAGTPLRFRHRPGQTSPSNPDTAVNPRSPRAVGEWLNEACFN